jgi:hypothetical protein
LSARAIELSTVRRKLEVLKSLVKHGVEISNPDSVVVFLNTCSWENGTKNIMIDAYPDYHDMFGLTSVELPHFKRVDKLPFIPLESEIDMVIAGVRIKMATMLQLLKETG